MESLFKRNNVKLIIGSLALFTILMGMFFCLFSTVEAAETPSIVFPKIDITLEEGKGETKKGEAVIPEDVGIMLPFQILFAISILSLAPYLLIMMTSFIRVAIVLSFIKSAMGTQQVPPTQVLMGLAIFVTFFVMAPVASQINEEALNPFIKGDLDSQEFVVTALKPIREFMFKQVREKDLMLFSEIISGKRKTKNKR